MNLFSLRKTISLFLIVAITGAVIVPLTCAATWEIKQKKYVFPLPVTRPAAMETFIITRHLTARSTCQIPEIHFRIGIAKIAAQEEGLLLAGLDQCDVTQNTPLTITGYTCELGSDQYNKELSRQRARQVATLLQLHGFTVSLVQGKGSQNPISRKRDELSMNRRVEIEITP